MKRGVLFAAFAILSVTWLGCYHATVETELQPSAQTIDEPWAPGWVFGLVPPKTVETAEKCTNGVARVETRLSFLNQLVGILTLGIYTPMHIEVTCAAGSSSSRVNNGTEVRVSSSATSEEKRRALVKAVFLSKESNTPVHVVFSE